MCCGCRAVCRCFRPLFCCFGLSLDLTWNSNSPAMATPLAATIILFNLYSLALTAAGVFPDDLASLPPGVDAATFSPLSLRQFFTPDRLPLPSGLLFGLDEVLAIFAVFAALLSLGSTSPIHNSPCFYPWALLCVAVSLFLDAIFMLPAISTLATSGLLTMSASSPISYLLVVFSVRVVTRTLIFFCLKLALFYTLLLARAPGVGQSPRAALWAAAHSALSGPEPALWALPVASKPGEALAVLRRGGLAGLGRSLSSLIACCPPKHVLACLMSFTLLLLFINTFVAQLSHYEQSFLAYATSARAQLAQLAALASVSQFTDPRLNGGLDLSAVTGYISFLTGLLDILVVVLDNSLGAIWAVFAVCLCSIASALVGVAQDHLRIMASFPTPPGQPPLPHPPFLVEDNAPISAMRMHVKGETPPHWASSIPFYKASWYRLTARCGLGGQPQAPQPRSCIVPPDGLPHSGGALGGGKEEEKQPAAAAAAASAAQQQPRSTVWLTPDIGPGVDKSLVPSFSYIFLFVLTQLTFGFYVTLVLSLALLGARFLLANPLILLAPLLTALLKALADSCLHYALTLDGLIARPRCWLLLDPLWGLLSILGSTPSALARFALAIVEGVLRSTQMQRPSATGFLAAFDPGFSSYMAVLRVRYACMYTAEGSAAHGPPMTEEDRGRGCCSDLCTCAPLPLPGKGGAGGGALSGLDKEGGGRAATVTAWGESSTATGTATSISINPLNALAAATATATASTAAAATAAEASPAGQPPTLTGAPSSTSARPSAAAVALATLAILSAPAGTLAQAAAAAPLVFPNCQFSNPTILPLTLPFNFSFFCASSGLASARGNSALSSTALTPFTLRLTHSPSVFPWCTDTLASFTSQPGAAPGESPFELGPIACTSPPCCLIAQCASDTDCPRLALDSWQVASPGSPSPLPLPSPSASISPGASPSPSASPQPPLFTLRTGLQQCQGVDVPVVGGAGGEGCSSEGSDTSGFALNVSNPSLSLFQVFWATGKEGCRQLGQRSAAGGVQLYSGAAEGFTFSDFCTSGICCFLVACALPQCPGLAYSFSLSPAAPFPASFYALTACLLALAGGLLLLRLGCASRLFAALDRLLGGYEAVPAGGVAGKGAVVELEMQAPQAEGRGASAGPSGSERTESPGTEHRV